MEFKKAIVFTDTKKLTFFNKNNFDTYCSKHQVNADDVLINDIAFYGWDEIEVFFKAKSENEFWDYIT